MPTTHTLTLNGRTFNPVCRQALCMEYHFMERESFEEIRNFLGFESMSTGSEGQEKCEEIAPHVYRSTIQVEFREVVRVNSKSDSGWTLGTRKALGTWVKVNDFSHLYAKGR